jgi:hypothetical protein
MRRWILTALLTCAVAAGQSEATATDVFDKAPPELDEALRARVSKFFQAHVDGKFRMAEEVIAEDSKDFFYNMEKRRYFSFDIVRINYSNNFTQAIVVTANEMEWRSPRIGVMRVKPPVTSQWKFENGQWFWYVVPRTDWDTPWGRMNPGPDPPKNQIMAMFKGVDREQVRSQVKIDNQRILLKSYEASSGKTVISNGMPGDIQLRMSAPPVKGLVVKIDKTTLKSGEQATITFDYKPETKEPKPRTDVTVNVDPIGQVYRISLTFDIPEELKKKLPQELQK